jgi:hypothetical protein
MADKEDFKPWPPADPQSLVDEINAKWAAQPGRKGKHWAVKVDGNNPISGYIVVLQPTGP